MSAGRALKRPRDGASGAEPPAARACPVPATRPRRVLLILLLLLLLPLLFLLLLLPIGSRP